MNRTCCCRSSWLRTVQRALTRRHRHHRPNRRGPNHRVLGSRVRRPISSRPLVSSGFRAELVVAWRNQTLRRVDPAPSSEPPRQIPSRTRRLCRRHVIDSGSAPGLAAQQPRQGHPSSTPQSETLDRLVAVNRTGRQMAAVVTDQRRQRVPVNPDHRAPGIAREPLKSCGAVRTMRIFHRRRARC